MTALAARLRLPTGIRAQIASMLGIVLVWAGVIVGLCVLELRSLAGQTAALAPDQAAIVNGDVTRTVLLVTGLAVLAIGTVAPTGVTVIRGMRRDFTHLQATAAAMSSGDLTVPLTSTATTRSAGSEQRSSWLGRTSA